jgi:hypothetical protein
MPQFNQQRPSYVATVVSEFIKGQEKINQVMLEQMQAISAQLTKLNAREVGNVNPNDVFTSTDRGKLPSKSETNPGVTRVPPEN